MATSASGPLQGTDGEGEFCLKIFSDHALLVLLAVGTVFTFCWLCLLRDRLRMKWYAALLISILHTVYGVITVKVFAFMETGFSAGNLDNMSLFGAIFFMPPAYWLGARLLKRSYAEVFDIFTVCMIATVMCARVNCIVAGCCQGNRIPGLDGVRWPTRELEIVFYVVLIVILARKVLAGKLHGEAYPIYMTAYGVFRFIIEGFRYSESGMLIHLGHVWALLSLILGVSIYTELRKKRGKNGGKKR